MENLPLWASGLAAGIEQRDSHWFASSPMDEVQVQMAPANAFGVLDHDVTLPDGVSQENFGANVAHVRRGLAVLKQRLEQPSR